MIGAEAAALLADEPVRLLPGIGPALARRLEALGITRLAHLQALDDREALRRLGEDGPSLARRARGEDAAPVDPARETKSVSAETTFDTDLSRTADLERHLWRLSEKLARRLREADLAAGGVVLKLKTAGFASRTRAQRLPGPTRLPDSLFDGGARLAGARGGRHRLPADRHRRAAADAAGDAADLPDLADPNRPQRAAAQTAIDALRARFGEAAISRGRGFASEPRKT